MHCSQTLMCFVAVLGATVGIAIAQERRVSVATKDGDLVEGTFRGATNASVSVVIAGQKISIPTDNVKYISFAGKLTVVAPDGKKIEGDMGRGTDRAHEEETQPIRAL